MSESLNSESLRLVVRKFTLAVEMRRGFALAAAVSMWSTTVLHGGHVDGDAQQAIDIALRIVRRLTRRNIRQRLWATG